MAWQSLLYHLISDSALLLNNGNSANPLNEWAQAMKRISSKRMKTDADHLELARLGFLAALYMGPKGPVIPAQNVDAMLIEAAKKKRQGATAKSGVYCLQDAPLAYDGPRQAEALWGDERFRHQVMVRVQAAKVLRTRPLFPQWQLTVALHVEDSLVNPAQVDEWMFIAGRQIGLGDWRPRYGRFSVERSEETGEAEAVAVA